MTDDEIKHRTHPGYNGYKNYGCRCDQGCLAAGEAIRARQRELRKEKLKKNAAEQTFTHGINGYRTYKCRCDVCAPAGALFNKEARADQAARRAAKKAAMVEEAMKSVALPAPRVKEPTLAEDWSELDLELAYLRPGHGVRKRGKVA